MGNVPQDGEGLLLHVSCVDGSVSGWTELPGRPGAARHRAQHLLLIDSTAFLPYLLHIHQVCLPGCIKL